MPDATQQWIDDRVAVLQGGADPDDLAAAATELANADNPAALEALGQLLVRDEFLDRLDPPDSSNRVSNLAAVMRELDDAPSSEVARLGLTLVDEPIYLEHDRKSLVLEALAAVVPMSADTADAFRRANDEGYFAFNALLLAKNGSPVALELYRSMMGDTAVDPESRVELVRKGIMPHRTNLAILRMAAGMLGDGLEDEVTLAVAESVFDYKPEWFKLHGPTPPPWRAAPNDVLHYVIDLGDAVRRKPNLASVVPAVDATTALARALLSARGA